MKSEKIMSKKAFEKIVKERYGKDSSVYASADISAYGKGEFNTTINVMKTSEDLYSCIHFTIDDRGFIKNVANHCDDDKFEELVGRRIDLNDYFRWIKKGREDVYGRIVNGVIVKEQVDKQYHIDSSIFIGREDREPENPELVDIYNDFYKRYKKYFENVLHFINNGHVWVMNFKKDDLCFSLKLWLFFDYTLSLDISSETEKPDDFCFNISLVGNKLPENKYVDILEPLFNNEFKEIHKLLYIFQRSGFDPRKYKFKAAEDGKSMVTVGYDPTYTDDKVSTPYQFIVDFEEGSVKVVQKKRMSRVFIEKELGRFNKRLKELNQVENQEELR